MFRFRAFAIILLSVVFASPAVAQSTRRTSIAPAIPIAASQPRFETQTVLQPTAVQAQPYIQQGVVSQQPTLIQQRPTVVQQQVQTVRQQQTIWSQPATQQPVWATQAVAQTQAQTTRGAVQSYQLINGYYYQLIGGKYYRVDAQQPQTAQRFHSHQVQTYVQPATQLLAPPVQSAPITTTQPATQPTLVDTRYRTIHAVIERSADEVAETTTTTQDTTTRSVLSRPTAAPRQTATETATEREEREFVNSWLQSQTDATKIDPNFELMKIDDSLMASFAPTLLDHRQFVEKLFETQRDSSQSSVVAGWDIREGRRGSRNLAEEEASPSDLRIANDRTTNELIANDRTTNDRTTMEVATFRPASFDDTATISQNAIAGFQSDITSLDGPKVQRHRRNSRRNSRGRIAAGRRSTSNKAAAWSWLPALAVLPLAWMFSRMLINNGEGETYSDHIRAEQDAAIMQRGRASQAQRTSQRAGHHGVARRTVGTTSRGTASRGTVAGSTNRNASFDVRTSNEDSRRGTETERNVAASASGFNSRTTDSNARPLGDRANREVSFGSSTSSSTNQSEFETRYATQYGPGADGETQSTEVPYQDFVRLRGIDATTEELLHTSGITHYWQLARTDKRRLRNLLDDAGPRFQGTNPGTWPKQAAFAMFGHWDELQAWLDEQNGGRTRGGRTMEAQSAQPKLRENQTGDYESELTLLEEANSLQLSVDRRMNSISEMDETRNTSRGQSEAWSESRSLIDDVRDEDSPDASDFRTCDDLTAIQGIGPATESFLNERGIYTYADLVDADVEELRRSLEADVRFRNFEPRKWQRLAGEISKSLS